MQQAGNRAVSGLVLSLAICTGALTGKSAEVDREVIATILAQRSGCFAKPFEGENYRLQCPWRAEPYLWRCPDFMHGKCDLPRRPKKKR
jgi:hypothetical protein